MCCIKAFLYNFHIPFLICSKEEAFPIISISYLALLAFVANGIFASSSIRTLERTLSDHKNDRIRIP